MSPSSPPSCSNPPAPPPLLLPLLLLSLLPLPLLLLLPLPLLLLSPLLSPLLPALEPGPSRALSSFTSAARVELLLFASILEESKPFGGPKAACLEVEEGDEVDEAVCAATMLEGSNGEILGPDEAADAPSEAPPPPLLLVSASLVW